LLNDKNLVELRIDKHIKSDAEVEVIKDLFKTNTKIRDIQLKFDKRSHLYECFTSLEDNYVIKSVIFECSGGIDIGNYP
jgi:hypothetical protein